MIAHQTLDHMYDSCFGFSNRSTDKRMPRIGLPKLFIGARLRDNTHKGKSVETILMVPSLRMSAWQSVGRSYNTDRKVDICALKLRNTAYIQEAITYVLL